MIDFGHPMDLVKRTIGATRNPSHLLDVIISEAFYRTHPNLPSITKDASMMLEDMDMKNWRVFEWGAGRSTLYFARRAKSLVSVEHDAYWVNKLRNELESKGLANVEMVHVPQRRTEDRESGYHDVILRFPDEFFDCIMIDADICRDLIIANCPKKLRSGGVLIMDNTDKKFNGDPIRGWPSVETTNRVWMTTIWTKP